MRQRRAAKRSARCAATEMPDWRALVMSVVLVATLALALHP